MEKRDIERYRERLTAKRADLLARVRDALSKEAEGNDEGAPDLGDRALNTISREVLFRLSGTERDILRLIDEALERMDGEGYGRCRNCGQEIQTPRLEAVPWARHCIACQELQDRGEI